MQQLTQKIQTDTPVAATLTLPWEQRTKSRLRITLDNGTEAGIFLARGSILRHGEVLTDGRGFTVGIQAAPEPVTIAATDDPLLLARICYHLGNRHVPLQITAGQARYLHDHVLDDMVRSLGGTVSKGMVPFEPEQGAYGGHSGHSHG